MNDTLRRDALPDYVTSNEPPHGVTASATLTAARRARRVRRAVAALAGMAATALAVTAALTVPALLRAAPAQVPAAPTSVDRPGPCGPMPAGEDQRQAAITCYLLAALPRLVPGASI